MFTMWKTKCAACLALGASMLAAGSSAFAAGGVTSRHDETRAEAPVVKRGRSVIFRAGELPRALTEAPEPANVAPKPALPTHYLETTLPVLIQGAPHELALRRYIATS